MVYRFVDENRDEFGLRWLLRRLNIYHNSYYNYLKNKKKNYRLHREDIYNRIKKIYYNNGRLLGHRGVKTFLSREGINLSKTTVHKYMNQVLGLQSVVLRKKPRYYKGWQYKILPNLINQQFEVAKKNKVWCTDFTYIRLATGKMRYNCTILDLHDRYVVATMNSDYINTDLALDTLKAALIAEDPGTGLILHSDRGSQFTSFDYVSFCKENGITQSMSRAGCPYDNAPMERFYNTMKQELIYRKKFYTELQMDEEIKRYVLMWYNHKRPHANNGYLTPMQKRWE